MKKLLKVSVLLAAVIALSACAKEADADPAPTTPAELTPLFSESDVASCTETPSVSDFVNGKWTLQTYNVVTDPDNFTTSWNKTVFDEYKATLSEAEQKEFDSWVFTPSWAGNTSDFTVYLHYPFDERIWVRTFDFEKLSDNLTAANSVKLNKVAFGDRMTITNNLLNKAIHEVEKNYTWEGNVATDVYSYNNDEIQPWVTDYQFMPEINSITSHNWKTNADKTKFYAESDTVKYYLIKNN